MLRVKGDCVVGGLRLARRLWAPRNDVPGVLVGSAWLGAAPQACLGANVETEKVGRVVFL